MIFQFPLFGVPVSVHWTTVFLFLLFFFDAFLFLKTNLKGRSTGAYIVTGIFAMALIMLSIVVHETAHALVANTFGFHITDAGVTGIYAYVSNGLSLSTIPPYQEFLIAFAGPASNFLLALLAVPLIFLLGKSLPESSLRYFSIMNIKLGRMNLWPIAILDGGWILNSIIRLTIGTPTWADYIPHVVSGLFILYLFTKKKGHFELEKLIDRIP